GAGLLGAWHILAEDDPRGQAALVGVPLLERGLGPTDRRDARRLHRLFSHQLAHGPLNSDLELLPLRPKRALRPVVNRPGPSPEPVPVRDLRGVVVATTPEPPFAPLRGRVWRTIGQ